jgi:large subunit ribosomal protein L3
MTVVRNKTEERDGYVATVVAFEDIPERKVNKPEMGMFTKAGVQPKRYVKEFKYETAYEVGATITCDMFVAGDVVDVSGVTKGHGFTGVIKRWNQGRLKMTHGTGPVHRSLGSTGSNSTPSKVIKGLHMPGQYGHENVTIKNLTVVKVDTEKNVILLRGAVPGPKGGLVTVKKA